MSKSRNPNGTILLTDELEVIQSKLSRAVTDSLPGISSDEALRPGVSNLIRIYRACGGSEDFDDWDCRALKHHTALQIHSHFAEFREEYARLICRSEEVERILLEGEALASVKAGDVWDRVSHVVGL